jgi:phosphohistidine phosphatase
MNLILWRHAEAQPGADDLARALTQKGFAQAAAMGHWLKRHLVPEARIIASPALRAQQTAQALTRNYETSLDIAPDRPIEGLLRASGWPDGKTIVLVGHQPALGRLAALLLSGSAADWRLRKGAAWWLKHRVREGEEQVVLHSALGPGALR